MRDSDEESDGEKEINYLDEEEVSFLWAGTRMGEHLETLSVSSLCAGTRIKERRFESGRELADQQRSTSY